ncbi:hypothetical protein MPSEU_000934100 [Mayamaea pseudoterrestris]|nr:hypothetical protein MPSEU_000934100 [Mayamaea pseudoterrestris]
MSCLCKFSKFKNPKPSGQNRRDHGRIIHPIGKAPYGNASLSTKPSSSLLSKPVNYMRVAAFSTKKAKGGHNSANREKGHRLPCISRMLHHKNYRKLGNTKAGSQQLDKAKLLRNGPKSIQHQNGCLKMAAPHVRSKPTAEPVLSANQRFQVANIQVRLLLSQFPTKVLLTRTQRDLTTQIIKRILDALASSVSFTRSLSSFQSGLSNVIITSMSTKSRLNQSPAHCSKTKKTEKALKTSSKRDKLRGPAIAKEPEVKQPSQTSLGNCYLHRRYVFDLETGFHGRLVKATKTVYHGRDAVGDFSGRIENVVMFDIPTKISVFHHQLLYKLICKLLLCQSLLSGRFSLPLRKGFHDLAKARRSLTDYLSALYRSPSK